MGAGVLLLKLLLGQSSLSQTLLFVKLRAEREKKRENTDTC